MLSLVIHQVVFPVVLVMTLACWLKVMARPGSAETCTLGGHVYKVGETWHPEMENFGKNCINCTCLPSGEPQCIPPQCPKPTCEEPKVFKGQCCPSCEDIDNLPPTVGTDSPVSPGKRKRGCHYQGERYEHRDVFPSNKTSLAPKKDQCVLCECYNGEVICHIKKCVKTPGCKRLVETDDDCCLQCAMVDTEKPKGKADCVTTAGIKGNGTTWKPIIFSFGEIKCVECYCLNTNVTCRRLKCPEESKLACDDPVPDQDGCCRECPPEKKKRKKKKDNKKSSCKNSVTPEEKEKCLNKDPKSPNRHRNNTEKPLQGEEASGLHKTIHVNEVINKMCIPKSGEKVVYYSRGENFIALSFDDFKNNMIYQTKWELRNNRLHKTENQTITVPKDFRQHTPLTDILGAVDTKTEKSFWKKLNKRQRKCKKKCRRKLVESAITKLKVIKIDLSKTKCRS